MVEIVGFSYASVVEYEREIGFLRATNVFVLKQPFGNELFEWGQAKLLNHKKYNEYLVCTVHGLAFGIRR
jgi:hypothetical protein